MRFTPRRQGSGWRAVDIAKIPELTGQGMMHPAGTRAFDGRRGDQVAVYAYENPDGAVLDDEQTVRPSSSPTQLITDSAAGRKVPPLTPR
ncbi:hypothetical protein ACWKSP_06985 [Micromonosporaceae bacterium Da 78-11]